MKFRKKPLVIDAIKYDGENHGEVAMFIGQTSEDGSTPDWYTHIEIETLEGTSTAMPGDWIIKGVKGEFYPVRPDVFEATYEAANHEHGAHHPFHECTIPETTLCYICGNAITLEWVVLEAAP